MFLVTFNNYIPILLELIYSSYLFSPTVLEYYLLEGVEKYSQVFLSTSKFSLTLNHLFQYIIETELINLRSKEDLTN